MTYLTFARSTILSLLIYMLLLIKFGCFSPGSASWLIQPLYTSYKNYGLCSVKDIILICQYQNTKNTTDQYYLQKVLITHSWKVGIRYRITAGIIITVTYQLFCWSNVCDQAKVKGSVRSHLPVLLQLTQNKFMLPGDKQDRRD